MRQFDRGPGPWIQPIKDHLRELVIEGELTMDDKDSAMQIAQRLYTELKLDTLASTHTSKQARRQAQNDRNEADKSH